MAIGKLIRRLLGHREAEGSPDEYRHTLRQIDVRLARFASRLRNTEEAIDVRRKAVEYREDVIRRQESP